MTAWIIGAGLLAAGVALLMWWWRLSKIPYIDGTPGLALIPGVLCFVAGVITLIAKAVG